MMYKAFRPVLLALAVVTSLSASMLTVEARAESAESINRDATAALEQLFATEPGTRELAAKAKAILIFPSIVKAGFMFGAQYGEGALRENGKTVGYYSSVAGSYGFQAGVQVFGYALFLMNGKALDYMKKSDGWELGVGPSIVIVEAGKAKSYTTTTLKDDVYGFIFSQKGLMAGVGVQGSKISKIRR